MLYFATPGSFMRDGRLMARWRICHLDDRLCPPADHIDYGSVADNFFQHGGDSLDFTEFVISGLRLHVLQLLIERQFLVTVVVGKPTPVILRTRDVLEQCGQVPDWLQTRIVVARRKGSLAILIAQRLVAGEGKLAIAGIDFSGKIFRLLRPVEDAITVRRG